MIVHAGIDDATAAAVAMAAVKIGVAGDDHALFQAIFVFVDLHDLGAEFVAGDTGIAEIGKCAPIRTQIAAANAAVEQLQQCFAFLAHRHGDVPDLYLPRGVDVNGFHNRTS